MSARDLPSTPDPGSVRVAEPLIESARGYARRARPASTLRTYAYQADRFAAWCRAQTPPLPTNPVLPQVLAAWIADRARHGEAPSYIAVGIAALVKASALAGHPDPRNGLVEEVWEGIQRVEGVGPRWQAAPFTPAQLRAFSDAARRHGSPRALRDRALVLLAFDAALRQGEAVALRVEDLDSVLGGWNVRIRKGKTDQKGQGAIVSIPRSSPSIEAVETWLRAGAITDGFVFRTFAGNGRVRYRAITTRTVENIVKSVAEVLGLDASRYSGHSMRAGFATAAAEAGKPLELIAQHGRWKRVDTVLKYIRRATAFSQNAAEGLL